MVDISVIISNYNSKEYVSETLRSIDAQTLGGDNYETIIVDDCSGDGSDRIIEDWSRERNNVVFLRNSKNLGAAVSRNLAIDVSSGKYLAILDADDMIVPSALEESLKFFKENKDVRYSYSAHQRMTADGEFMCVRPSQEFSMEDLLHYNFVGHLKCFDRDLHDLIGGYNSVLLCAQDWDHVLKAAIVLGGEGIARNDKMLYNYRWHSSNMSNTRAEERKEYVSEFLKEHLATFGIDAKNVRHSHMREDLYNYFTWDENENEKN